MKYTNILEKLQYLLSAITSSYIYMSFIVIVTILSILYLMKKIDKKKLILSLVTSYLILFIIEIIFNYEELSKVLDSIMTNLFTNIYFPSTYSYLFVLIIVNISFIVSNLKVKLDGIYKKINTIIFLIMQFILILIMDIISKNNIDIFSKKSLFTNTKLVMMLELSINIFIVWLLLLAIIFIVNTLTEKALINQEKRILSTREVLMPTTNINIEVDNNKIEEKYNDVEIPKEEHVIINNNIKEEPKISFNDFIKESTSTIEKPIIEPIITKVEEPVIETKIDKVEESIKEEKIEPLNMVDMLLNNKIPVLHTEEPVKEKEIIKNIVPEVKETRRYDEDRKVASKETYTLNDYKTFNKMLKEIRMYNLGSIVNIDRTLELRLLDKFSNEEYNLFKTMLKSYSN